MRKFLQLALLNKISILWMLAMPMGLLAQTTAFTATITDTDGNAWANGTYQAQIIPSNVVPYINGSPVMPMVYSGTMNGSGTFSVTLPSSNLMTPTGFSYRFTICPNASAGCYSTVLGVSGATQNGSAALSALAVGPRFPAGPFAYGYADVEVTPIPLPGGVYYNVLTPTWRQWNGTSWVSVGGGGGGSGTVTTVSGLTPLFTTSNPTTTPSFALNNQLSYSLFGNFTNSSAAPTFSSTPSLAALTIVSGGTLTFPGLTSLPCLGTNSSGIVGSGTCGTGTVTNFTAGNFSPLFTTSVSTGSSTPALTFTASNASAGTLFGNAGGSAATPSFTINPVLGVAGSSVGTLGFNNATSGTITLAPAAGALGTVTATLPANTGTLAELNLAQTFSALQTGSAGFNFSGASSPLEFAGSAGTSGQCPISGGAGVTPSWGPCGSGTISGQASGVFGLPTSATAITAQSAMDQGVTTAGTITTADPFNVNVSGQPSQATFTYNSTALVPGSATAAVFGVNSSGQAVVSEAGGTAARICDATNAVCASGGTLTPSLIQSTSGNNCAIKWENPAGTVVKIELFSCSSITDYGNASTVGSLEWAIVQLGTNGGLILMHPGIYPVSTSVLIDWDWITIQGTELPYWSGNGDPWPTPDNPGTPGGAQLVTTTGIRLFTIGNTSANMHGDVRHKGIKIDQIYGYGSYTTGSSFIGDLTATQNDDNMRVENSIMQGYESCVITEQWDYHDISRNTIQSNGGDGVCEAGGYYGYIVGNIIYDNGGEGVTLSGGVNTIVADNRFGDLTLAGTISGGTGEFVDNVIGTTSTLPLSITTTGWTASGQGIYASAPNTMGFISGSSNTVGFQFASNEAAASFMNPLWALTPNQAATDSSAIGVGLSGTTNNMAFMGLYLAGSGSTSNYGCLDLYGGSCALTWWPNENVGIGYTSSTGAPPDLFSVNGVSFAQSQVITNPSTSSGIAPFFMTAPSMATGGTIGIGWGPSAATNNMAFWNFYYNGSGSTGNYVCLNFYAGSCIQTTFATGDVAIGSSTDPGHTLGVTGATQSQSYLVGGTTFTASGCSNTTLVGGATAGSFHSGTSGTCTVTITMGNSRSATNGWACYANDLTTTTDTVKQTATTTTTATLAGTTVTGDVINFACIGY